ncbi:DUF2599 domain-containing protein [Cryobacterium zongtaii]|nr:DUF2599 domain-containing protein [Cryobacterium zongtaii]
MQIANPAKGDIMIREKSPARYVGAGFLVLALTLAGGAAANADDESSSLAAIRAVAPDSLGSLVQDAEVNATGVEATVSDVTTLAPTDASEGIAIGITGRHALTIGLPGSSVAAPGVIENGTVSYENGNGSSSVALANSDGSVSLDTVIQDAAAPAVYAYELSAPEGAALSLDAQGGVTVSATDGKFISYLLPPTALDASGDSVQSSYAVEGQTLVQTVNHQGAAYPVVAMAAAASRFFSNVVVDTTADSRGHIVRVYPIGTGPNPQIPSAAVFDDYKTWVSATYEGQKFRDQLICHVANAQGKSPWNLDAWRPNVGYAATVAALCNP